MRYKIFGYTASPNPFRKILTPEDDYVPIHSGTLAVQEKIPCIVTADNNLSFSILVTQ